MREAIENGFVLSHYLGLPPVAAAGGNRAVAALDLDEYFDAALLNRAFAGQTAAEFQAALAQHHANLEISDCDFYHTLILPDGTVTPGQWDLRGDEAAYTGEYAFAGKRVLEIGPGGGAITAYLDRSGAEVTVFDTPFGSGPELVPYSGLDLAEQRRSGARSCTRQRNGWWYARRALGFQATAVYGDLYDPPPDLGRFDVAVLGSVLLRVRDPFLVLQRAAALTDEAVIVTEVLGLSGYLPVAHETQLSVPVMVFNPTLPPIGLVHWWSLSPGAVVKMLQVLGFTETTVTTHTPPAMQPAPTMFTVVGRRPAAPARVAGREAEPPLPPPHLRYMVAGTDDASVFLDLGRRGFEALMSALHEAGTEPSELGAVLDFGCGVGRVLRYWHRVPVEMYGTDINPDLIGWARDNLRFARFATNPLEGPLPYADGTFGFVYALSVFTHFPEPLQIPWLAELLRVLRPGGLLYFTTHGSWYSNRFTPEQAAAFNLGRLVVVEATRAGSNFCAAYHPESYVRRLIGETGQLRLLAFHPEGAMGNPKQDSWLVQKLAGGPEIPREH
jgi:SAM-dependent methyltransferase